MIRVLQVIHSMNLGGAENFIMNMYRSLNREEVQFDFLVNAAGVFDEEIRQMGGKIWMIPYVNKVGPFRYRKELRNFFLQHPEYQVVHSHLDMVSGEVIECAKKAGVQRCITHSHNTDTTGNFVVQSLKKYYQRKIPCYADVCMACSEQAGIWLYKNENAIVMNNAIDLGKFLYHAEIRKKVRDQYHIPQQAFVMGHVGRFNKVKNQCFLVDLFEKYLQRDKDAILILCGGGPEKRNIEKKILEKKLMNHVIFFDASPDVYKMYSAMDIFVFPSIYEGMSLAMLEAQANGIPIVASSSIDSKSAVAGHVTFVNLNDGLEQWLVAIEKAKKLGRYDGQEQLRAAGYDIHEMVKKLLTYYYIDKS